jgi:hypothetical protein
MKKILLVIVSVILILTILLFIFIPGKLVITESRIVNTTGIGFDSCLHNLEKWKQWWPGDIKNSGKDSLFSYHDLAFKLLMPYSDGADIQIGSGNSTAISRFQTVFKVRDSVYASWSVTLESGNNPIARLSNYFLARKLKKSMQVVFDSLYHFAENTENIYGYPVIRTTFTEENLIAAKFTSAVYPSTDMIYKVVNQLQQYLISQGAREKYYPMMNTKMVDSTNYETMVAISIDKIIPASKDFFISKMVTMKDRFLETEVTGGPASISKAKMAIEKYMTDHTLPSPARPFEIMVTDRSKVTDTSKWKTKIYYPSM